VKSPPLYRPPPICGARRRDERQERIPTNRANKRQHTRHPVNFRDPHYHQNARPLYRNSGPHRLCFSSCRTIAILVYRHAGTSRYESERVTNRNDTEGQQVNKAAIATAYRFGLSKRQWSLPQSRRRQQYDVLIAVAWSISTPFLSSLGTRKPITIPLEFRLLDGPHASPGRL
jgi:hypothetical protein